MVKILLRIGYRVVLERPDKEEISRIVMMLCWAMQKMRNDLVCNQKKRSAQATALSGANLNRWIHISHLWGVCCPRMEKNTGLNLQKK